MTKKEPLLSICIPTYNREKYLKRLLDSIVCQKEFTDTDDVEIVVDDGPSTDNTETMVKDYIKKYWNKIKYYRNPVRIWMCPAFLEALDYWTWKYLWLMGSDDSIFSKSLEIFFNSIKNNPKVVLCKRYSLNDGQTELKYSMNSILSFKFFIDFLKKEKSRQDIDVFFTFISVWCLERCYYKNALELLIREFWENILKQHYFNFSFIWFSNVKESDRINIIDKPRLIQVNSFDVGWKPNMKIWNDLKLEMKYLMKKYSLNYGQCKILKNIYRPWRLMCILYPIRQCLGKIGLLWIYDELSKIYRKLRGYL